MEEGLDLSFDRLLMMMMMMMSDKIFAVVFRQKLVYQLAICVDSMYKNLVHIL